MPALYVSTQSVASHTDTSAINFTPCQRCNHCTCHFKLQGLSVPARDTCTPLICGSIHQITDHLVVDRDDAIAYYLSICMAPRGDWVKMPVNVCLEVVYHHPPGTECVHYHAHVIPGFDGPCQWPTPCHRHCRSSCATQTRSMTSVAAGARERPVPEGYLVVGE